MMFPRPPHDKRVFLALLPGVRLIEAGARTSCPRSRWAMLEFALILLCALSGAGWTAETRRTEMGEGHIQNLVNKVEYEVPGYGSQQATQGQPVLFNYRVRTGTNSRANIRLTGGTELELGQNSLLELRSPPPEAKADLDLKGGLLRLFTRIQTGVVFVHGRFMRCGIRGTEVIFEVSDDRVQIEVEDGQVEARRTNDAPLEVNLRSREGRIFLPAGEPKPIPITRTNAAQWWLYYPAVVDPKELAFTEEDLAALGDSWAAYRQGNVVAALRAYPPNRTPQSEAERIYVAALLLAAGNVQASEELLCTTANNASARALRLLIDAVNQHERRDAGPPLSASEWLAQSYYEQSQALPGSLAVALEAARQATKLSPGFGFAWARVAELEFSHGRSRQALDILNRSLKLAPSNAPAYALQGFLRSAENRPRAALDAFAQAIALDGALGQAWLGQGLVKIRLGQAETGRADLQTAAALEPNRSLFRSYLGKAFNQSGLNDLARKEFALARRDTNDPTPWLYLGLLDQEENKINPAVRDLERSLELNDNRRIYRSRLLLDQDRAVRGAQLAAIYRDAGLVDLSVREAGRSVDADYANYSAHYFLSDSFNALRDSKRINLRYETAWFNERLLADLLAPVGGGPLSRQVSEQEYSRLFEVDRFGLSTATEYFSGGDYRQLASQYGTAGRTRYALDLEYQHFNGTRPNNEQTLLEWFTTVQHQLTPRDLLYVLAKYEQFDAGDTRQLFDPADIRRDFRFHESQEPIVLLGYHHEWSPNVHTLMLAGRLVNDQRISDRLVPERWLSVDATNAAGQITNVIEVPFTNFTYRSRFETWSAELNQIVQTERQIAVLGTRVQTGGFQTMNRYADVDEAPLGTNGSLTYPNTSFHDADLLRVSPYAYYTLKPRDEWLLTAGLTYDRLTFPRNFREAPVVAGESSRSKLSPKAAVTWTPRRDLTARAIYSQSLGGVSFDESIRLEPTQLAGFNQAFRSIISESIAGSVAAPEYETWGAALDWNVRTGRWFSVQAERLQTRVRRDIGVFHLFDGQPFSVVPAVTRENLDYEERALAATFNQLIGDEWAVAVQYRFIESELARRVPALAPEVSSFARSNETATLHQLGAEGRYFHPSGFFARVEGLWWWQDNADLPNESFPQVNLLAGWRFRRNRGVLTLGLLNVTAQDYRLNPLTPYLDLPRERTFYARVALNF